MDLQKVDTELFKLESIRGDLPNQVSQLKQELEEAIKSKEEQKEKSKLFLKEHGIIEMEIKALEGKQSKYQSQLFKVKTNREYDAVTHEIDTVKANISKKESQLLEFMELEEDLQQSIKTNEVMINDLKIKLDEKKAELKKRMVTTEKEEKAFNQRREKLIKELEPRLLKTYERIRKAKNGLAVVSVGRGSCGGCFNNLPPQRILEIRDMDRMYLCEVCGRILVWDEDDYNNKA
jgi:predicted  nucleic acid-binding Zn-ribbon protein